jgi:HK97 family phage prohead protease/HK97 family phage major capsid protein
MKTLTFSAVIEASDTGRRVISGKIVPFNGEVGMTSAGPVIFERGSIQIPAVSKIKLLAQHEKNNPIGRMQNYQESLDGIYASFKVSAASKGTDFLIMASEGLIDGLSVGVEVIASKERKDGTLIVTAAKLQEVSLVESPAFENARVLDVAAQAAEEISETVEVSEEPETLNESEATVSEDTTAATTEAAAAPVAAEASRPTIKASTPYISTNVRHGITSMGRYVESKIKASQGDAEAREWIAASEDPQYVQAAADSIGTTNPAFNPIQYMKELYVNNRFGAPARDAVSRGTLPTSGMTFQIPSLVTSAGGGSGVAPTVAVTAESASPSNTGMETQYITGTVSKYAGQQTVTLELLERSNPVFFDELAKQMELAYLKSIDAAILSGLVSGGTVGTKNYAASSAGIIDFVSTESALAYQGTSSFAKNYLAGISQWTLLMGATDSTGRPIYNAVAPMNAGGNVDPTAIKGNVLGLDLYVDYQAVATTIDDSAFIIVPDAVTWYESPTSYFSVNNVGNMQVQTAIYGYGSLVVKNAKGIRRFNVA